MEIEEIKNALEAVVLAGGEFLPGQVDHIYASDLMSDVLAFGKPNSLLLTGLASQQAVISAHMAEFKGVVFVRGKKARDGSAKFASENGLVLLSTGLDMYDACVRVDCVTRGDGPAGLAEETPTAEELSLVREFRIEGSDFASAGMVSTAVKSMLKQIGLPTEMVRRVAICTYEGEMNVVMHAVRAQVTLSVSPQVVEMTIDDEGKGIVDVEQAMQEGFTTATEEMRAMGFGSGMGLPNIKRNTDELTVDSEVGKGTRLIMRFLV